MNDLISREALLAHLFSKQDEPLDIMKEIAKFPAVDAVPVVHGRWIAFRGGVDKQCSECNWGTDYNIPRNYCPNCGTRMDLPEGEEERHDK